MGIDQSSSPLRAVERAGRFLLVELWSAGAGGASRLRQGLVTATRIAFITVEGFFNDLCMLRASALTFASLMALVPTLALGFSVLRGLGWHGDRLEEAILGRVTMLSPEAIDLIVSYIDNTSFAGLGVVGGSVLFLTFVSVMNNIETSFNAIWGNVARRAILRRITDYFGVMVIAPVLFAIATSLTAVVQSNSIVAWMSEQWALGPAVRTAFGVAAYSIVWLLFAFVYSFIPNTRVGIVPALVSGVFAGTIWHITQWAYIRFQVGMANYNAIYGAMAQLPLLMAWIYVSWVIVLLGAELSVAIQNHRSYSRERRTRGESGQSLRDHVGLNIAADLAAAADGKREAPTVDSLAAANDVPARLVREILGALGEAALVHTAGESVERCYLSKSPDRATVAEVLSALHGTAPSRFTDGEAVDDGDARVRRVLRSVADARRSTLAGMTLRDLVVENQGAA